MDTSNNLFTLGLNIEATQAQMDKQLRQIAKSLSDNKCVQVTAGLNIEQSQKQIQSQLNTIANNLKVGVHIDTTAIKQQTESINRQLSSGINSTGVKVPFNFDLSDANAVKQEINKIVAEISNNQGKLVKYKINVDDKGQATKAVLTYKNALNEVTNAELKLKSVGKWYDSDGLEHHIVKWTEGHKVFSQNIETTVKANQRQIEMDNQVIRKKEELIAKMNELNTQALKAGISLNTDNQNAFNNLSVNASTLEDIKQLQHYYNMARTEYRTFNAEINKGTHASSLETMKNTLQSMPNDIKLLEAKFHSIKMPESVGIQIEKLKADLQAINSIADPNEKISKYNEMRSSLQNLQKQYQITSQEQKNLNADQQAMQGAGILTNKIILWMNEHKEAAVLYDAELKKILADLQNVGNSDISNLRQQFRQIQTQAEATDSTSRGFFGNLKYQIQESLTVMLKYHLSYRIIQKTIQAIKSMIETICELDATLTEFNKVADLSTYQLERFTEKAFESADKIGRTGKDMIEAATEFRRAGYDLEQSLEMGNAALIMTNVAEGIDQTSDAASTLISVLKGFNISDTDIMSIVDKINSVSNQSPVGFDNLADGLERVSGTMSQAGNSIDETIGLLTGGFAQLRNMEKVSTGLITISQRLRAIDEDGEEIDGLSAELEKSFGSIGISIEDSNGELRSTYDILSDYAKVFPELTSEQKQYFAELASGKRQVNVFNAIIQQMEDVDKAVEQSVDSIGAAEKENEIYRKSIQGMKNELDNKFQMFATEVFSSDWIKDLISAGTDLLEILTNIVKQDDLVSGTLSIITDGVKALAYVIKELSDNKIMGSLLKSFLAYKTISRGFAIFNFLNAKSQSRRAMDAFFRSAANGTMQVRDGFLQIGDASGECTRSVRKANKATLVSIAKYAALAASIYACYKLYDHFIETSGEANKRIENRVEKAVSEYDSIESSLEDVNSKLEENKNRIKEINSLDNPTYVEVEELEKLKETNAYLEENKKLLEESKSAAKQETVSAIYDKFRTQFYTNKTKNIEDVDNGNGTDSKLLRFVSSLPVGKQIVDYVVTSTDEYQTDYEQLDFLTRQLKEFKNARDELIESGNEIIEVSNVDNPWLKISGTYDDLSDAIEEYTKEIDTYRSQILLVLNEISEYDPNYMTDEAKVLISLLDHIEATVDFDTFGKNIANRVSVSSDFSAISQMISEKLKNGILTEEDLITDNESAEFINKIAQEMVKAEGSVQFSDFMYKSLGENYLKVYEQQIEDKAKNSGYLQKAASYVVELFREEMAKAVKSSAKDTSTILTSVEQIKKDLSSAFKELGSAYTDIFQIDSETAEIKFSLDNVNNDMLSGLKETFSELEGFDTSNLEDFFAVLTNGASTADDVQKAFNRLAGAYLYSSEVMNKLNKETAESVAKQLEAMGITNANALVNEALSLKESWVTKAKENNISTTHDLNNATYEEISALKDENGKLDETEQKLYAFWMEKNIVNDTTIDTNADINNLIGLMNASGKACEALTKLYKLKSTLAELDDLHDKGAINTETYNRAVNTTTTLIKGGTIKDDFTKQTSNIKDLLADAQKEVSSYYSDFFVGEYNVEFNGGSDYQSKLADARESAAEKQEKDAEKSKQTFDWIETKINNLTDALNRLKDTSDDTYTSWADRSTALVNAINTTRQAIDLQQQAYNRYMQEAEKSGLSDAYKNLIQNGALDISVITDDDLKEKISDYQTWYDKAKNCLEVQEDLKNSLNELNSKKFDNIQSIFDFDISKTEHLLTLLNHQTDKLEMKGLFANESYYNQMLQYTQTKINTLTNERKQLADIMNSSALSHDSEAWQKMYTTLSETDEEISSLNKDLIEFNNNIRDLNWEIFEYLEESINRITDETEYLINLIANKDLFEDNGNFNKYADATAGLHVTAYDTYRQQAQDYLEEMQDLQKQLVNGAGKDVLEQYNKMVEAHRNAINSANDERNAILDLIEEGYNAQLEALQKIIDKKKEQMSAEKNLYDYQKTIREKTDNISSLEKQQAAYAKDDSEETMSKIQQLKVQLEEAKADLKETEYEQYLSDTENMLDELSTDYEEWMNARLDNEDALLSEIIGTVASKGDEINATLNDVAKEYGTTVSDNITSIFNSVSPFTNILTNGFNNVSSSIAATTSAIDRLIAQVAGITNAIAGKTNAGSGTSGNGNANYNSSYGNSAGNINTGSNGYNNGYSNGYNNSNGSNNNSASNSNTNNNSVGIFIHKTDSYPKDKLLKETSIVDRLKYNDFDSSFPARASYYSKLGGSGTYRGSDSQNTWMIQKMKSMGYKKGTKNSGKELAWTQEDGGEIIRTKDGAVLTPLDNSMVFNNESSRKLWEFSQNPTLFMEKLGLEHLIPQFNVKLPDYSSVTQGNVSNEVKIDVDAIDINLPNVTNYKDFRSELIKDNTFTNAIGTYVNNQIMGKNPLEHLKYVGK